MSVTKICWPVEFCDKRNFLFVSAIKLMGKLYVLNYTGPYTEQRHK